MINNLRNHLNKPVQASIPALFGDAAPRVIKLIGIEPAGLWLAGDDCGATGPVGEAGRPEKVFAPFAQIAYIAVGGGPETVPPRDPPADSPRPRRRRRR